MAGFGVTLNASGGFGAAPGAASARGKPAAQRQRRNRHRRRWRSCSGEITWLMTQSPRHKAIPLGDLEWLVMPAILLKQFRMFYKGAQPVGVAVWAMVDDLVAKRIDANDKRLSAVEWKSGTNMRIIDIVAPFGAEAEMRGQVLDVEVQK